jgi:ubiquinone biosynthesis protein
MPLAAITLRLGIGYLILLPFWIAAIGVLTGRVLGIHLGRWRSFVAASFGWLVGLVAGALALGPHNSHALLIVPLSVFFGVIAALPMAIILDVVTHSTRERPRSRTPLRHPVRVVRSVVAPLGRFRELLANAREENLLHVRYRSVAALASPDLARRLRVVLERSGGMFVKFGQIAATRSDLLPPTLTDELANLHADVARIPPEGVDAVLHSELGEPVEKAFDSFDAEPLAAASIGQAHRAKLHDGRAVIVKLQRPGLDDLVRRDAAVLRFIAAQLDRRVEAARRVGIRDLAQELITSINNELDYGREVAAGIQLRENRASDVGVGIPIVHPTLSTERLLVMDEVVGRSVSDTAAVDAVPVSRPELARHLLASFLGQILRDGYYHADPHPGNVLIDREGTLWLLDFGAVGRINAVTLEALQGFALGFKLQESSMIARSIRHLVGNEQLDLRNLERDLAMVMGEFSTAGFGPETMGAVLGVMEKHGLRPPASMLLLSRTLLTLEGTLKTLEPSFDLAGEAEQLVAGDSYVEHVETIATQLRGGRLTVRTERYAGSDRGVVNAWLNRVLVAAASGAGAVASGTVLVAGSLAPDKVLRDALWILGFSGLTGSAILLMRIVAQSLHSATEEK